MKNSNIQLSLVRYTRTLTNSMFCLKMHLNYITSNIHFIKKNTIQPNYAENAASTICDTHEFNILGAIKGERKEKIRYPQALLAYDNLHKMNN